MPQGSLSGKFFGEGKSFASQDAFRLLAENLPGAIYLCENDTDYSIIYLNDHIETITGYPAKDFLAKKITFASLLHPEDQERVFETFKASGPKTKSVQCTYRLRHASGEWRWINETRVEVCDGGNLAFIEGFLQDITSQKEVTLQLQDQNRRLDEFAHIISHNLRAPVNNIQALINLLNEKSQITDYKLIFEKLKNVSKNLGETMNELMDTLKAKTQPEVDLVEIRFKEVLDKVVQSLEGELIVAQADVTFDFNEASTILYSKPYLESIFQNLLTNAIKYRSTHRKPLIHFKTSLVDNHLELQVSDNGRGIDMARFGDEIFGLHKTFHEHQEARGVGLFLIKTQIEALGGSIAVNSEVDKGTTFIIRFN